MMAKLLLLSDIFSKTQATQALAKSLDATLLCANDTALPATQQHQAYQQFIAKGGHDEYLRRVMQALERFRQVDVIGFSAGASAAWRAISQSRNVSRALLFYPTQIRHHVDLVPSCNTDIIFARHESAFDVKQLMATLSHPRIHCHRSAYEHGFMNPLASSSSAQARDYGNALIAQWRRPG
ncbi:dienelactone hydrolase family protein [Pseudoalteromonas ruthenica]|uniref:dienelactone hydrolase family protein n=1 Tax=Pseudoalteromonas ruthenica TaxID=151081 RepID=UPI00241BF780|nr:dienelactone hydrolase family protein [Pseudoalteromonas ruthenica]|tara:strand:- start:174 stop:716 length:543 start_codon:yes stop_codon:yes gene_type:complete